MFQFVRTMATSQIPMIATSSSNATKEFPITKSVMMV